MNSCEWCRRGASTERLKFLGGVAELLSLCVTCARLLGPQAYASDLHDDLDVRCLAQETVEQRLADVFASGTGSSDRCWWCDRPGAAIDSVMHDESGRLLFEAPVLCDVCIGLSGHVAGGFASTDEMWERSVDDARYVVDHEQKAPVQAPRVRSLELMIAKLALLEVDARRDHLVNGATGPNGVSEFAHSLGLAEWEAEAHIHRLWNESEAVVTFTRFHTAAVPVLSVKGRRLLAEVRGQIEAGPPYPSHALSSRSLHRAFDILDELQNSRL